MTDNKVIGKKHDFIQETDRNSNVDFDRCGNLLPPIWFPV